MLYGMRLRFKQAQHFVLPESVFISFHVNFPLLYALSFCFIFLLLELQKFLQPKKSCMSKMDTHYLSVTGLSFAGNHKLRDISVFVFQLTLLWNKLLRTSKGT
jgi:hypothetical protein